MDVAGFDEGDVKNIRPVLTNIRIMRWRVWGGDHVAILLHVLLQSFAYWVGY